MTLGIYITTHFQKKKKEPHTYIVTSHIYESL